MIAVVTSLVTETARRWVADGAFQLAAAISFFTAISLAPLVTLTLAVAGAFYGEQAARGDIVSKIDQIVGRAGAEVIQEIIAHSRPGQAGIAGAISVVLLFLGASAVFLQLQQALNRVWNVELKPDISWTHAVTSRLFSMAVVLVVAFLLLAANVARAVIEWMSGLAPDVFAFAGRLGFFAGVGMAAGLFTVLFKVLPDAVIRWRDAAIGGVVTAVLFEIGRILLAIYLSKTAPGSSYGASGSLVALLLWINYSSLIVLFGAEFAQVFARWRGEPIRPASYARLIAADPA